MEQLRPPEAEEPTVPVALPRELAWSRPASTISEEWPGQFDMIICLTRYWHAKGICAWNLALRSLRQARSYAIAGEKWELESRINAMIVEAVAKREARRR